MTMASAEKENEPAKKSDSKVGRVHLVHCYPTVTLHPLDNPAAGGYLLTCSSDIAPFTHHLPTSRHAARRLACTSCTTTTRTTASTARLT